MTDRVADTTALLAEWTDRVRNCPPEAGRLAQAGNALAAALTASHEREQQLREALAVVTEALDDAIASVVNDLGWSQEDYDGWVAARDKGESLASSEGQTP